MTNLDLQLGQAVVDVYDGEHVPLTMMELMLHTVLEPYRGVTHLDLRIGPAIVDVDNGEHVPLTGMELILHTVLELY